MNDPLDNDALDTRRFGALTPREQLAWLDHDSAALAKRERDMRAAERALVGQQTKEMKP